MSLAVFVFVFVCDGFSQKKAKVMSVTDFETLVLGDTAVQVIDVRSPEAFNNGHIVRAQNMPYGNGMSVRDMINRIDNKRPVAIYCQAGKKSKAAAKRLCRKGVKVYLLDQGIDQWRKERRELMR